MDIVVTDIVPHIMVYVEVQFCKLKGAFSFSESILKKNFSTLEYET